MLAAVVISIAAVPVLAIAARVRRWLGPLVDVLRVALGGNARAPLWPPARPTRTRMPRDTGPCALTDPYVFLADTLAADGPAAGLPFTDDAYVGGSGIVSSDDGTQARNASSDSATATRAARRG